MYDRLQGVLPQPVGEGTHFRVPWFQTPNVMDIRTRPRSISSVTGTKGPRDEILRWSSHLGSVLLHRCCAARSCLVCGVADLQMVNITLRVLSKPDVETLSLIFKVRTPVGSFLHFGFNRCARVQT